MMSNIALKDIIVPEDRNANCLRIRTSVSYVVRKIYGDIIDTESWMTEGLIDNEKGRFQTREWMQGSKSLTSI